VSDGELSDNATVTIIVNDVNRPPKLVPIGSKNVNEGEMLTIVLNATDPDEEDALIFSSNVSFGAFISDENTTFWRWTPDYDDAGVYYVEFTVSDGMGGIDNETVRITVEDVPYPPVAMFSVSNETPTTNQTVIFDASASYDPDGEIIAYRWDFDSDGIWDIEGNVVKVTHNYNKSGIYNAILEVEDEDGAKNRTTKEINVSGAPNGTPIYIGKLSGYLNGAVIWISGNVIWEGNHTFNIRNVTIGSPLTITATAYEIKNELNENVSVTAELRVDGVCLNKNKAIIEGNEQNGTISVSATWIPMSSGMHDISLHIYNESYRVGPINETAAKVEVFIEKVEQ